MGKSFEDYFSKLQADMVSICLEYVKSNADAIYIYCSYEPDAYYFDAFYKIDNSLYQRHELDLKDKNFYDSSITRQRELLKIGKTNLQQIHRICQEFNHDMPTEIKLYYNVEENNLKAKYKYELVYSNDETLLPDDIFDQWFNEVKKE